MKINLASLLESKGMNAENINAKRILIETEEGNTIVVEEPSVAKTEFLGMDVLLVLGKFKDQKS